MTRLDTAITQPWEKPPEPVTPSAPAAKWHVKKQYRQRSVEHDIKVPALWALVTAAGVTIGAAPLVYAFEKPWYWSPAAGFYAGLALWILIGVVEWFDREQRIESEEYTDQEDEKKPEPPKPDRPPVIVNPYHGNRYATTPSQPREVDAPPEVQELYRFITTMWPTGDVTQDNCRRHGFGRGVWDHMIGGSRNPRHKGTESARGVLDRAGVIEKQGNVWKIAANLDDTLACFPMVRAYAETRTQTVILSPTSGLRPF